jgi:hypothetical protein
MHKLKRKAAEEYICFYFTMGSKEMLPLRRALMFQKNYSWANEYDSFQKKLKIINTPMN